MWINKYFCLFHQLKCQNMAFCFVMLVPVFKIHAQGLCCDRWKTCLVTLLGIIFPLCGMQGNWFQCHEGPLPSLAFPSSLSSWCAAGETIPESQLLGGQGRGGGGWGGGGKRVEKVLRDKSWLRAMTISCPSPSAPAVPLAYIYLKNGCEYLPG